MKIALLFGAIIMVLFALTILSKDLRKNSSDRRQQNRREGAADIDPSQDRRDSDGRRQEARRYSDRE